MIKTFIVVLWTVMATIGFGITVIVVGLITRSGKLPHRIARIWAKSTLWVSGVSVTVCGRTHFGSQGSYIFMPNHQSQFDIPLLMAGLPVQFRWLAKAELFRIPILGHGMRACGYIGIDRSDRQAAIESLHQAAVTIRNGTSVLIFPEGTRSRDGRLLPFKKGGFVTAVQAGVPIVPVVIEGTFAIMPKTGIRIRAGQVRLEFLEPIDTTAYSLETKDDLLERVHAVIAARLTETKEAVSAC